ncbi:hypothetical protein B0181_05910 [Moraxella caviae]|uniref:Uncharacterized protein n=1 Tax=Moraxella caviae TaxID=34060 RepID=A0A1T0A2C5_9GAMM|nr:hypothetical protein [Moraxella caviae]OOR89942.1 hypothetical protein B0181_05910 [Moraxella caviae]STZ14328.1 Uncharacterised protein [Moraxella caviae]
MIYGISLAVYVAVFAAGLYIVRKHPAHIERLITKICLLGFLHKSPSITFFGAILRRFLKAIHWQAANAWR